MFKQPSPPIAHALVYVALYLGLLACSTLEPAIVNDTGPADGCVVDEDCPGPQAECKYRECFEGTCRVVQVKEGYATASQKAGDCLQKVCDAEGAVVDAINEQDAPVSNVACVSYTCDAGTSIEVLANIDDDCTDSNRGNVCDDKGQCVDCLVDDHCKTVQDDCGGAGCVCDDRACVSADCTNTTLDGNETDIDCGGPVCNSCDVGKDCKNSNDCSSAVCSDNGACLAPTCSDGAMNGDETDVDCGGEDNGIGQSDTCPRCADGQTCIAVDGSDCLSLVCEAGACALPTCTDGVTNGAETDVDCGGSSNLCARCKVGKTCQKSSDCESLLQCKSSICVMSQISK